MDIGAIAGSGHANGDSTPQTTGRHHPHWLGTYQQRKGRGQWRLYRGRSSNLIVWCWLLRSKAGAGWQRDTQQFPTEFAALVAAVKEAAHEHDLVLVNAGSSAGSEDYTAHVIDELGEVLVHGIAVRPGHPVIFGIISLENRTVPVIGVPGYPVSAALTGEIFIEPAHQSLAGEIWTSSNNHRSDDQPKGTLALR